MTQPLAQQILDLVYHDREVRRMYKEALTNWILDTQPRTAPLNTAALLEYLAAFQQRATRATREGVTPSRIQSGPAARGGASR